MRIPISIALGMLARKGAEQLTSAMLSRVEGVPGNERPEPNDLDVKLRYALLAAAIEGIVFAVTRALADRGTQRVSLALTGQTGNSKRS